MRVTVVAVGRLKEKFYEQAVAEYAKRLGRYCKLEVIQVADEKTPDGASETVERQIKEKEGKRILAQIKDGAYVIALAIQGEMVSSEELADKMAEFVPVARAILGMRGLKIITFGPRPQDFFACNAPIKGLYELGVEVEENSELDLLVAYRKHANDPRIPEVCADMAAEMGEGKYYPDLLARMAQFELTLLDWAEEHKGSRKYVAFADKCWPAFPEEFGFEPCYVNSRLATRGIPVACEVDIYGALSEYIGMCVSGDTGTLLDINNSVPGYIYKEDIAGKFDYSLTDTFMGFHCGNTPSCKMCADRAVKYQLIQHRLLEPEGSEPDFTRGTLEATSLPLTLPSTASSATARACCGPTSPRARCCRWLPAASVASACSLSPRWAASTAMC